MSLPERGALNNFVGSSENEVSLEFSDTSCFGINNYANQRAVKFMYQNPNTQYL